MAGLTPLGAARAVTGSKYLLDHRRHRILVDCGSFQGPKEMRLQNWENCPLPPDSIDAVSWDAQAPAPAERFEA